MQPMVYASNPEDKIYALNTSIEQMQRLLRRLRDDSSIAQVSPALIKAAIDAARGEVQYLENILRPLSECVGESEHGAYVEQLAMIARLKGLLDAHERALFDLDGWVTSP